MLDLAQLNRCISTRKIFIAHLSPNDIEALVWNEIGLGSKLWARKILNKSFVSN